MNLYEHIDLTRKFQGGSLTEAVQAEQGQRPDKTSVALDVARHLAESKPCEDKPIQLGGTPVAN
jgi:hypothetical protein